MGWKRNANSIALIVLIMLFSPPFLTGQTDIESELTPIEVEPYSGNLEEDGFSEKDWENITDGLSYGDLKEREEPKPIDNTPDWNWDFDSEWLGSFIMTLVIVILAVILIYLIAKQMRYRDKKITRSKTDHFELDALEEDLPRSDLEIYLDKALARKDYRSAIRIYYLMVIQGMHEASLIQWEREKTNYQYLQELRNDQRFTTFSELTLSYEIIWYGNADVDHPLFQKLEPRFQQFIQSINPTPA